MRFSNRLEVTLALLFGIGMISLFGASFSTDLERAGIRISGATQTFEKDASFDDDVAVGGDLSVTGTSTFGASGTAISQIIAGTVDMDNGATTDSLAVTGAEVGDLVILSPIESLGSATKFSATVTTGALNLLVDQDPGTTVSFNYLIIK